MSYVTRGERHLARLERLEERYPSFCGRWGFYPLIVIHSTGRERTTKQQHQPAEGEDHPDELGAH